MHPPGSTTRAAALTTSTVALRADFACPTKYGLYPDPENCTQYYECYKGNATIINCPPGQLFSRGILACNYAEFVKCDVDTAKRDVAHQAAFQCPSTDGFYPDPASSNIFYRCVEGIAYQFVCPDGQVYDPQVETCA